MTSNDNPYRANEFESTTNQPRKTFLKHIVLGVFGGAFLTLVMFVFAFVNSGLGHGSDWVGRAIFPWSALLPGGYTDTSVVNIAATFLQFPIYGLIIAFNARRNGMLLFALHGIAVAMEFID